MLVVSVHGLQQILQLLFFSTFLVMKERAIIHLFALSLCKISANSRMIIITFVTLFALAAQKEMAQWCIISSRRGSASITAFRRLS